MARPQRDGAAGLLLGAAARADPLRAGPSVPSRPGPIAGEPSAACSSHLLQPRQAVRALFACCSRVVHGRRWCVVSCVVSRVAVLFSAHCRVSFAGIVVRRSHASSRAVHVARAYIACRSRVLHNVCT
jgi:hypothetical protein